MKLKLSLLLLTTMFFSAAWADMFCPSNFNAINMGDTLDAVVKACGKPDSKKTTKQEAPQPQEWIYYLATNPGMPGTMKVSIAFDASEKAINISVNGSGMTQTQICNGAGIQVGDNQAAITKACGKPAYVSVSEPPAGTPKVKATEITELKYGSSPAVTLVFTDGKLTERK
jgi:hypothetical protein